MSLDQVIKITIDRDSSTPSRAAFGVPLILGYFPTSVFPERTRSFSSLQELLDVGFVSGDPIYIAASDIWAQNPSPPSIKVGRRVGAPAQTFTLTPGAIAEGDVFSLTVAGFADSSFATRGTNASTDTATYTALGGDTATDVCNGLRTSLGTPSGDFTAGGTSTLTLSADNTSFDGHLFSVSATANIQVQNTTAEPATTLATDLAAVNLYDPDWYALVIDSNSEAEINAAAAWIDTVEKIFVAQTQDYAVANTTKAADTTSIAADLNSTRVMLFNHQVPVDLVNPNGAEYVCGAMLGYALPQDAGSINWAWKELASVSSQRLTTTQIKNLHGTVDEPTAGKDVNALVPRNDVAVTAMGQSTQGEFIDIQRGADWLKARIQEDVYAALIQSPKIPYTDAGIAVIQGIILARLQDGVDRGFIAATPEPTVLVPRAEDVSAADKSARLLQNVVFRATLAGAINFVAIEGQLSL